jgi:hypothetical protein
MPPAVILAEQQARHAAFHAKLLVRAAAKRANMPGGGDAKK